MAKLRHTINWIKNNNARKTMDFRICLLSKQIFLNICKLLFVLIFNYFFMIMQLNTIVFPLFGRILSSPSLWAWLFPILAGSEAGFLREDWTLETGHEDTSFALLGGGLKQRMYPCVIETTLHQWYLLNYLFSTLQESFLGKKDSF